MADSSDHSLIGPTVVIKGELRAEENLMVMGRIEGFIDHSKTVTIHAQGTVAAEVKAQEVLVEGTVDGNVYGTKRVQIAETGNVNGNVFAPRVGVLEGASFKGAIDMDSDAEAIERRFREKTGTESAAKATGKVDSPAKKAAGDNDAEQTEEKGNSDAVSSDGASVKQ
jgi:cytoskeletal protein CcmA (bactofilin family)